MDLTIQTAIKRYNGEPTEQNKEALNAILRRVGLPPVEHTDALRTISREVIRSIETRGRVGLGRDDMLWKAKQYVSQPYGAPLIDEHDDIMLAEWLFGELDYPSYPHDAQAEFATEGSDNPEKTYEAMLWLAGCANCNQYVRGCICEQMCPECGSIDCNCADAMAGYPHQVGTAFGGPVAIWVSADPTQCGCGGGGWSGTDYDSWHQCPLHYTGQQHPEY